MEEITEYESFKTALWNIVKNSNRTKPSKHTRYNYRAALKLYLQFVNSEERRSTLQSDAEYELNAKQMDIALQTLIERKEIVRVAKKIHKRGRVYESLW